jgi:lactate dehydrogenase-like 2-hydroxyacid dehydrogenase
VIASIDHGNKRIATDGRAIEEGLWGALAVKEPVRRIRGATLFIVGLGRIGSAVAAKALGRGASCGPRRHGELLPEIAATGSLVSSKCQPMPSMIDISIRGGYFEICPAQAFPLQRLLEESGVLSWIRRTGTTGLRRLFLPH